MKKIIIPAAVITALSGIIAIFMKVIRKNIAADSMNTVKH